MVQPVQNLNRATIGSPAQAAPGAAEKDCHAGHGEYRPGECGGEALGPIIIAMGWRGRRACQPSRKFCQVSVVSAPLRGSRNILKRPMAVSFTWIDECNEPMQADRGKS